MSNLNPEIATYVNQKVPDAIGKLTETKKKIEDIIKWCSYNYQKSDKETTYQKTEEFTTAVFTNVVYYVNQTAKEMTRLFELQTEEVEKLTVEVNALSSKFKQMRTTTGRNELSNMTSSKDVYRTKKARKIHLPQTSVNIVEGKINWNAYDDIGISLGPKDAVTTRYSTLGRQQSHSTISSSPSIPDFDAPSQPDVVPTLEVPTISADALRESSKQETSVDPNVPPPLPSLDVDLSIPSDSYSPPPPPPTTDNYVPPPPPPTNNYAPPPPPPPAKVAPPANNVAPPPPPPGNGPPPPPPPPPAVDNTPPPPMSDLAAQLQAKKLRKVDKPDDSIKLGNEAPKAPAPRPMSMMDQMLAQRNKMLSRQQSQQTNTPPPPPKQESKPVSQTPPPPPPQNVKPTPPPPGGNGIPPPPPPPPPVAMDNSPPPPMNDLAAQLQAKKLRKVPKPDDSVKLGNEAPKAPAPKPMSMMDQILAKRQQMMKQ